MRLMVYIPQPGETARERERERERYQRVCSDRTHSVVAFVFEMDMPFCTCRAVATQFCMRLCRNEVSLIFTHTALGMFIFRMYEL
jgi:hypothetical protein